MGVGDGEDIAITRAKRPDKMRFSLTADVRDDHGHNLCEVGDRGGVYPG
jgi:hypothetical protein